MDGEFPERERISSGTATEVQEESRCTEMTSLSENTTANGPRSRRVDSSGPPEDFRLSTTSTASTSSSHPPSAPSSPPTTSPPIPPRSPLRPPARAAPATLTPANAPDAEEMPLLHSRSFGSMSGLLDQPSLSASLTRRPPTPDKPLPLTPQPSDSMPLSSENPEEDEDDTLIPSVSTSARSSSATAVMSKRNYALNELLTSERSYASDLALIRVIHIPLALGQPSPFSNTPATPPGSSASSSRTLSTASDSSAGSTCGPPMTREDVKVIFNNVAELAVFADSLAEDLEQALGDALEGGTGTDYVGALFLETIPQLDALYRPYITKHPTAVEHLNNLSPTPSLTAYLTQTRALASTLSHAWDLPSLLIKPVQRLLKYPLLLSTIIEETPDSHPDKENLRLARDKLEEVAREVNEGRRRREVVREVLQLGPSVTSSPQKGEQKAKKKGLNIGIAASVSLGRMKSVRSVGSKAKEGAEANEEAETVKALGEQVKQYETALQSFSRDSLKWAESVHLLMSALDDWAQSFGRVIWMVDDVRSEAFEAFLSLISEEILPVCDEIYHVIEDQLQSQVTNLVSSTTAPLRLLEAMHTLEPLHYGLLNLSNYKSRPPPQLLEASQSYVALRAQLYAELPDYLRLFGNGIAALIYRFALIQQRFYSNVRDRWADLWDALKVDEEANQGAAETLRVWWGRFAEVEAQLGGLNIVRPLKKHPSEKLKPKAGVRQRSSNDAESGHSAVVSAALTALDPLSIPRPRISPTAPSFATSPEKQNGKARSLHSLEGENYVSERKSVESLHSKKSGKSRRPSTSRGNSMASSTLVDEPPYGYSVPSLAALAPAPSKPAYSRTKSMPLSPVPINKTQSVGRYLDVSETVTPNNSNPSVHSLAATLQEDSRGRPSRKPSFRRRLTDSFRSGTGTISETTRHRRSPSLPTYSANPSPSPNQATFTSSTTSMPSSGGAGRRRPSGGQIPPLYECRVIHSCEPPDGVSYRDIPFFTLRLDDVYAILQEAGHPSTHRDLPLYVDDGEDCLLLARNEVGDVGWVLASFLLPVD